jgi:Zn-dependent protease with chaperone function
MYDKQQAAVISNEELKQLLHPKEKTRFLLALLITLPIAVGAVLLIFASAGMILFFILAIVFVVWFVLQVFKAALIGGSVKVSQDNFPEIYEILMDVKKRLNYNKSVDIYIVEGGSVNAFLYKFFQTKFIVLNSDIVSGMSPKKYESQLMWIIGRFVGSLKAKHMKLQLLSLIINSIEKIKIFNFFILPYERATQYSGDQIGLALCNDFPNSIEAFNKLLIGKDLAEDIQLRGILQQANELHYSFFGWFSKIISTHPHLTDRYLNLMAFARYKYPNEFQSFCEQFDNVIISEIGTLLPKYYPLKV